MPKPLPTAIFGPPNPVTPHNPHHLLTRLKSRGSCLSKKLPDNIVKNGGVQFILKITSLKTAANYPFL